MTKPLDRQDIPTLVMLAQKLEDLGDRLAVTDNLHPVFKSAAEMNIKRAWGNLITTNLNLASIHNACIQCGQILNHENKCTDCVQ